MTRTAERVDPGPRRYDHVTRVVLIGGGDLMVEVAELCRRQDFRVSTVLAPRHAEEALTLRDGVLRDALSAAGFEIHCVDDINQWLGLEAAVGAEGDAVALCFGPAWIFSPAVRERFAAGMINFNGIPVPRYLGGAHYSWQIMNGDRSGGCVLQDITGDVDRGPILRAHYYELPSECRIPADYYRANLAVATAFLAEAIADMRAGVVFEPAPFADVDAKRFYFPRLYTPQNAFIDWRWPAAEVERFICAFDEPYPGAASFLDGNEVRFSGVHLEPDDGDTHPYTAGLVVRRYGDAAWIAANGGVLAVRRARFGDGTDAMPSLKEGKRLHTPADVLAHALAFRPVVTAQGVKATAS